MVPAAFLLALLGGAAVAQPVVQTTSGAVAGVSTATVRRGEGAGLEAGRGELGLGLARVPEKGMRPVCRALVVIFV